VKHPRIIHRVWLGPNTPDPEFVGFGDLWAAMHPGWLVVDWDDDLVLRRLPLVLQAEYDAAPTYVHRHDIVLPEAVYAFGGVAVGYDMEPLKNIEPLIGASQAWCTPDADGFPGGAFFGATAGHPGLARLLTVIGQRVEKDGWQAPNVTTGPFAWRHAFRTLPYKTGEGWLDLLGTRETAYPIHYNERELLADRPLAREVARERGAYALHYFAQSWLPGEEKPSIAVRGANER
jgi:hypothetical protein